MKQRPILVAVIGYIMGIIWGLYFKFSIVPFYILICATYYLFSKTLKTKKKRKFNLLSYKHYSRYLKLFINKKVVLILISFSIISNTIILIQNKKYENTYQDNQNIKITGVIISQKTEKQYYDLYEIKTLQNGNFNMYIQVAKNVKKLEYGDKITLQGEFIKPSSQRNYKGYDDSKYLKTLKIIGRIKVNSIKIEAKNQVNFIFQQANKINEKIKTTISKTFDTEKSAILNGLLLGDKQNIEEKIRENFQTLNISHVLAISGMHIGYIIVGIQILLKNLIGKRKTKIVTIIILICYTFITGFSPSILRATIMGILGVSEILVHRKNDIWNAISISLLIILLYNPFLILDIGLQLSYLGTIGIILFHNTVLKIFNKIISKESKIIKIIQQILSVTISAQVIITPILLLNFHTISIYSLFANLVLSIIIGPIVIIAFIGIILSFINAQLINIFKPILDIGLKILNIISNFSKLPFSKFYIQTPSSFTVILYFIIIFIGKYILIIYTSYCLTPTYKRIKNLISLFKYKFNIKKNKYIKYFIICFLILLIIQFIPKNLKIYFVDVGQGDCTFIVTPKNKTILIDGGGSLSDNFDVGKKTLLPYLLNRGYTKLDYIMISHFDQDHVGRNFIFSK